MNYKKTRIEAVVISIVLLGAMFLVPVSSINQPEKISKQLSVNNVSPIADEEIPEQTEENVKARMLDTRYVPIEDVSLVGYQNDIGYNTDAGPMFSRGFPIYVGEPVDQGVPGRGRTGTLDPDDRDDADCYYFSVCEGQSIQVSLSSGEDFDFELADHLFEVVANGYTATESGMHYVKIFANSGAVRGDYTLSIALSSQNDAGTGSDAGNDINQAVSITPGSYSGYMEETDWEDWYSFTANSGQGIFVTVDPLEKSDFDIYLYNPLGELVHSEHYYGEDELEYPADASGIWKIKIDMFPGWDESKWSDDYFLYGSGVYEFSVTIGGLAEAPPGPVPQPEIYPVAQTFKVTNDPDSSEDEYAFLAAVPAATYLKDGKRYVSPVVYEGDDTPTHWAGVADDTTQYLLDDWDTYLARHDKTATVYQLSQNPVQAAAEIATAKWSSASTAVLTVDGSVFQDEVETVLDQSATLNVNTDVVSAAPGDSQFKDFAGYNSIPISIGKEWGAITVYAHGDNCPGVGLITPRYELGAYGSWPHPDDVPGDNTDIYYPIAKPGIYMPYIEGTTGDWTFEIIKYKGDRYTIPIQNTDSSVTVSVTSDEPSYLEVFLVDPQGSIRRPMVPHWNGGPINPMHIWNGDHHYGFEDWRRWEPTLSTEHYVEIHYPMEGKWTAIVAPHYPYGEEKSSDSIPYDIKVDVRSHNSKRVDAGLSAANAAVVASLNNAPLLYVTEDSVPSETSNALTALGVTDIIFINLNGVSSATPPGSTTECNSLSEIIEEIQTHSSNVVTIITSFGTEDGFFAPAGFLAAYHGGPVLSIGEVPDAYNILDKLTTWREYAGGWYHGCRSQGHLSHMEEPINIIEIIKNLLHGDMPPLGVDQQYRWCSAIHDEIRAWADGYGLHGEDQEVYIFVSPLDTDIRLPISVIMTGQESYAGQIPFDLPSLDAALISRDILYPAIIYANPGKDVITSQFINYPDGWQWTTNDGVTQVVYSTREMKNSFMSHGRFYEGHCIFDNWLERINTGASFCYYSGHGTGGSGISNQYKNVAEQFPAAELRHENLHDFEWWDSWRAYSGYDDKQTKTARWGGTSWYNAAEPSLYDFVHFKYVDEFLENLHSNINIWQSCTTAQHFGPLIYLEHGVALWFGNADTGWSAQADLLDYTWVHEALVTGQSLGEAFSKAIWLHQRDFTAIDPEIIEINMYGGSSLSITNIQVFFGDPTLIVYSPEWTEPTPIDA